MEAYLEERLWDIDVSSRRFNNLTREECNALYSFIYDPTIIIKGVYKSNLVIVWERDNYSRDADKQL